MSDLVEKGARHTPCENCREHRRKCSVLVGTSCERCRRMNLVCLFKYTNKPKLAKAPMSMLKNMRQKQRQKYHVADQIRQLQHQAQAMEAELQALRQARDRSPTLTVRSRKGQMLRLEASVRNMADMIGFLEVAWRCFYGDLGPIPQFHNLPGSDGLLAVAPRMQLVERIVKIFDKASGRLVASPSSSSSIISLDADPAITQLKRRIIHTYFSCTLYFTPLLVRPYFLDYLLMNPHSMIANAVVTFLVHGPCKHVSISIPNLSRDSFAALMFEKSHSQLREVMFEDESLDTMITMWYLASCFVTNLKMDEARVLMTLAWRMAIQLKATYVPILEKSEWDDPVSLARAETWRRLFYQLRYNEMNLSMIQDNSPDFYQFIEASKHIGRPAVLPSEKIDVGLSRAVEIYGHLISLSMLPGGFHKTIREEIVGHNLYAGIVDNVSQADIAIIEQRLIEYWVSLPEAYVLADQPIMSILNMDRIRNCKLPSVLYLNMMYYLYWIIILMRLMSPPETADLTGASLDRLDGDHALMIISVCCDAVAKIAHVLFEKKPCVNDVHWVMVVADLLLILKDAMDSAIRARAEQNLQWIMAVLSSVVDKFNLPNTSPVIPNTYYGEIKAIVTQRFLSQEVQ